MQYDFSGFFAEYEKLRQQADSLFQKVWQQCPEEVACDNGCTDCCYALFDLSLVEAMYINFAFQKKLEEPQRQKILERADQADRQTHKIKYYMAKEQKKGKETAEILQQAGSYRVRCPLLNDEGRCDLYEDRPITCRIYGVPMAIGNEVHTCFRSGFKQGGQYPTVYMDRIQDRLMDISQRLVQSIPTKHVKLEEVMVPLSMALMNEYNEDYLGIVQSSADSANKPNEWVLGGED
ncbi:MAG: YkgJ family cysteine cluster protein [Desulfohalobiaceae bacterium]|nr:YkgJ family cysteine cluster protein [Desulfohalobiaceae bacterium]